VRTLVVGASGRFARIADLLLTRGHRVRVTARQSDSASARRLEDLGAEIVYADFDQSDSLVAAARGVDALFASGTAHHAGPEGEIRHGRNLVEAAVAADVPHLTFVSGDGAAPDSPLPLFRAKWEVEQGIRDTDLVHTILAPTYLMENLFNPWNVPALQSGVMPSPIPVDRPLQHTAIADLLSLAVLAIERPDQFAGRRIALASDELTAEQAATLISARIPQTLEARQAPAEALPPGVRFLFAWLGERGHHVDIDALRDEFSEVGWHRYANWIDEQLDRFRELCPDPEPAVH
jgi:uncharacterized protein YbjT (DUF2867 family)